MKHLISLNDCRTADIHNILNLAVKLKAENKAGISHSHILKGKSLGMIFAKSSTRTRVSFEVGMYQLGGQALYLNNNDIQMGRGESIYDTANVLSRFLDGIMIRTFDHQDVLDLAKYGSISIINGLTDLLHPCQILADFQTIYEHKGTLEGLKVCYVGDGNNISNSLLYGCTKLGMDIRVATPVGYECTDFVIDGAKENAKETGSVVLITNDPAEAIKGADVVITDTWVSMGQEEEKAERIKIFKDYTIDGALFKKADSDAIFMHCLPAYRGYEVTEEVIDGPHSVIFDEAENRLHAQKAVMALTMGA